MTGGRFKSSTRDIPEVSAVPRHIAIIMDGNGRWARKRLMPRVAGHSRGVEALRAVIRGCIEQGVEYLTVFAFSSENWRRPQDEVSFLMQLFLKSLQKEVARLHENGIRFRVIGDLSRFDAPLVKVIREAEALTAPIVRRDEEAEVRVDRRRGGETVGIRRVGVALRRPTGRRRRRIRRL